MNHYYKTEGNIIYPDKQMLTWGPFYYHNKENAVKQLNTILDYIIEWVNTKDPSLNIKPEKMIKSVGGTQIVFSIKAWKDENTLQDCDGIITVDDIFFEDEKD